MCATDCMCEACVVCGSPWLSLCRLTMGDEACMYKTRCISAMYVGVWMGDGCMYVLLYAGVFRRGLDWDGWWVMLMPKSEAEANAAVEAEAAAARRIERDGERG